jgi:hypothetical protein
MPLADWTGRSALGFGHARRDLAAGDLGGADAEGGPDVDRVDLFFGRPEADALREDLSLPRPPKGEGGRPPPQADHPPFTRGSWRALQDARDQLVIKRA